MRLLGLTEARAGQGPVQGQEASGGQNWGENRSVLTPCLYLFNILWSFSTIYVAGIPKTDLEEKLMRVLWGRSF